VNLEFFGTAAWSTSSAPVSGDAAMTVSKPLTGRIAVGFTDIDGRRPHWERYMVQQTNEILDRGGPATPDEDHRCVRHGQARRAVQPVGSARGSGGREAEHRFRSGRGGDV